MFSVKTFAVVFSALVANTLATDCTRTYTVQEGDICDSISAAHQVSTYQLAAVNSGIDSSCSNLVPGQQLCLGTSGEDCTKTYVVQPDDTCEGINGANGLNSTILYLNNPQINQACDNLYIGEVLCVSGDVQSPPAPAGGIPATTIPSGAVPAAPSPTLSLKKTVPVAPKPKTTPSPPPADDETCDDEGDEECDDEEDLPFCDEL